MPERRAWLRIGLLAFVVLAVHLWLLGAIPRVFMPAKPPQSFIARTVSAPPAAPAAVPDRPAAKPVKPAATAPRTAPEVVATKSADSIAPRESRAPPVEAALAPASAASEPSLASAVPPRKAAAASPRNVSPGFSVAPSARFHYDVIAQAKGITLQGSALLEWRNDGREYDAQLTMSAPFLRTRTQRSTGLVTPQGLAPLRFSDKSRSEEATHFDRDNGKLVFSNNKPEAPLEAGMQDRLSIVLQLGAMLAGNPSKFPTGTEITVPTASTKEAEPWSFTVEGKETLDLPGGRVATVRLARNPRREHDVKVELWLAPGAAYAPVRLRLTQPNGDWVDQQWSSTDRG